MLGSTSRDAFSPPIRGAKAVTFTLRQYREEVLDNTGEEGPGRGNSRVVIGTTAAGRILRVISAPDPHPHTLVVVTAYDLRGKPLAADRRRQRRKGRR